MSKPHRMRCNACRSLRTGSRSGRFTLPQAPDAYVRKPSCPHCGEKIRIVSVEHQRVAEMAKRDLCRCGGLQFPHARGTHKRCTHHPQYKGPAVLVELNEDEEDEA